MQLERNYCGILKGSSEWQADKCLHIILSKTTSHCSADSNNYNYSFIQNVQHVSRKNTKSSSLSVLKSCFLQKSKPLSRRTYKLMVCQELPSINISPTLGVLAQSGSAELLGFWELSLQRGREQWDHFTWGLWGRTANLGI